MELPAPATYKEAKNGGKILLTSDGHEFSKNKDDGKKNPLCLLLRNMSWLRGYCNHLQGD